MHLFDADQRHFVHDEQRVLRLVRRKGELAETVASDGFLPVDMLVDCKCRAMGIRRQDLRGAARRGKEHARDVHARQGRDDSRERGGLARSGIAVHDEYVRIVGRNELPDVAEHPVLAGSRLVVKMRQEVPV